MRRAVGAALSKPGGRPRLSVVVGASRCNDGVGHDGHATLLRRRPFSSSSSSASAGADADGLERHRERYREAMRKLGATSLPPMTTPTHRPAAAAGAAAAATSSAAPPLTPEQVLKASKLSDGEAVCQDPALVPSLNLPALLFLADVFWTGLVVEPPKQTKEEESGPEGGNGLIVPQDHAKAARLWREASDKFGDKGARYNYAQCLLRGHGVPENAQQAEQLLTQLVDEHDGEGGDPCACYSLAVLLYSRLQHQQQKGGGWKGDGSGKEAERVYTLLRRAVKGGVLPAVHNLANLLAQGHGPSVPRDDAAAFALYEQGAALGDPWSTFTLGSWLCQGRGGEEEDWEQGFTLHKRAADAYGMPQAAFNVGTHYFSGRGVEQDFGQAARYFEKAARAGMTQGMVNLGNMYLEGLVPPPDGVLDGLAAARVWYRRAAEAGDEAGRECLLKCEAIEKERAEAAEKGAGAGKGTER